MEPDFWHRRWQKNEIGFHEEEGNPLLRMYFKQWQLPKSATLFLPLCGKTRDIAYLLDQGIEIVAIELNKSAVEQLFEELGCEPEIDALPLSETDSSNELDLLYRYSAPGLNVYVGDFFRLTKLHIGRVDGVYDRAALVALPLQLREKYSKHLKYISDKAPQFLICFDYEQNLFKGPPFSVDRNEVSNHYANDYSIEVLYCEKVKGGFRGQNEVNESVYLLTPNA